MHRSGNVRAARGTSPEAEEGTEPMRESEEEVILVDERDRELGASAKLRAHREGALHRAFSVFVFDDAGRLLLQKRASGKYHSGGLWSNTACGHPRPGEATEAAARRRLREEMNFDCELREEFSFLYRAELEGGLVEHEYDHVFTGTYSGRPAPDPAEVEDWEWVTIAELRRAVGREPARYSRWLRIVIEDSRWHRLRASGGNGGVKG